MKFKGSFYALMFAILAIFALVIGIGKTEAGWNVITVPAGGNLQAALDAAKPGDSIRLQAGATYVGHFTLRAKGATAALPIIIRSTAATGSFPTGRISPSYASLMPKIKSPDNMPAIQTDPGKPVSGYLLRFVEVVANQTQGDLIMFGTNDSHQTSLSQLPKDFEIDRCYIHGTSTSQSKRGVGVHAANVNIHDSYFTDFHVVGQDSQAIGAVNTTGPLTVTNNHMEAGGEILMTGGDDPKIVGILPQNITVRYNRFTRPMSWKGGSWQIKNLLELKVGETVLIEGNVFENHWPQAQSGPSIVMTPRNQYGSAPQNVVGNVTFRYNIIRNVSSGITILGHDNNFPTLQTHDIEISNNIVSVNRTLLGGDGRFLNMNNGIGDGAKNVTVVNNTIDHDGTSVVYTGGGHQFPGFEYSDNLAVHGLYGIMSDHGIGNGTLAFYYPNAKFINNVLAGGNAKYYPGGTLTPTLTAFYQNFVGFTGGNYALSAGTTYTGMGADVAKVLSMTAGR